MKTLSIGNHFLAYEDHSQGEEIFVFLHGWSSSQYYWHPVIPDFLELGRVVTLSLPGHYPSKFPENTHSFSQAEFIEIVAQAIKSTGLGKKVTLIGHSAGGMAAIGVAGRYPELVSRLIAICPASHGPLEGALYPLKMGVKFGLGTFMTAIHKALFFVPMSMELFFANAVHNHSKFFQNPAKKAYLEEYKENFKKIDSHVMWLYLHLLDNADIRPLASMVQCPAYFILGDHDKMIPRTHGVRLAKLVPNAQSVVLDCGHLPTLEETEKSVELMKHWLATHPVG
jgi:pimeloyl-ACP methyl ester carboxylesterase